MIDKAQTDANLTEVLINTEHNANQPFNLFLRLSQQNCRNLILLILGMLDSDTLQNLMVLAAVLDKKKIKTQYVSLFDSSKVVYLQKTRAQRAETLRDHVMYWRYVEAKACVQRDPQVLAVRCDYKANRWLADNEKNTRTLSALEYAWWAGDENFIELFERLGATHLNKTCYENKASLQAESVGYCADLAKALNAYTDGGAWSDLKPIYYDAPTWIFGLAYHLYKEHITTPKKAIEVDIYSDKFRAAAGLRACRPACQAPNVCGPRHAAALSRCLSVKVTHPRSSSVQSPK